MNQPWHIQLFGTLRASQEDRLITRFRTQKTGALLAYLAYFRGRSHTRETLIELFWPDTELDSGRHSLSLALSSLRSLLEPPGVPNGAVVVADRFSVELNPEAFTTDVSTFEQALRVANQARQAPDFIPHLAEAVAHYGGTLLPEYYEEWITPEQERLAQRFNQAASSLINLLERSGDLEHGLETARRVVTLDSIREAGHRDLIRLLMANGQPENALRQYRELERILNDELGCDPDASSRQILRQIETQLSVKSNSDITPNPVRTVSPTPSSAISSRLPFGTVSFLMTDIEQSTVLWEKAGDIFRSALSTHHALLRREFKRFGGHEVKEAGDSFLIAFEGVSDSLACTIACQRALAIQPWPETAVVKVRMALHTGDVELEEDEYHGLMLHHLSRILGAGHGGQILCSEATTALLRRDLEPDARFRDLGLYRLRSVELPERIFQVEYPNMAQREFSALNADHAHTPHLPLQFTRFFGRGKELSDLQKLLRPMSNEESSESMRSHLVTLTGPGGTGKTRLAIEAAAQAADVFEGAVWFVPLADVMDASLLISTIADALNLPRDVSGSSLTSIEELLSRQLSLLLLDNMEHLLEGGAEQVQELLKRVPSLSILITSRKRMGLPGEQEYSVPPLPVPGGMDNPEGLSVYESVRLFVDRAQAVKPDFRVTNQNAPAVAELCNRLEGIPLAIELAAARAQLMTPVQMLQQLSNRFDLLVSRQRGVSERQRTLRAAIDWSYKLLSPELQRFFSLLSVFRGGMTVEATEAVCDQPLALDLLAQLRESSLILTEEGEAGMRFRMMEMLREYAREQLSDEEKKMAAHNHARYYLEFAERAEPELRGENQAVWLTNLEEEHDNLRAALAGERLEKDDIGAESEIRICGALWYFWSIRGHVTEGRRNLENALDRLPADHPAWGSSPLRAKGLMGLGALCLDQGDYSKGEKALQASIELWRLSNETQGLATALNLLANAELNQGKTGAAQPLYEEALALFRAIGDKRGASIILSNLGVLAQDAGDTERAAQLLSDSIKLKRTLGNRYGLANSLDSLGSVERDRGGFIQAALLYEEALSIRRELGHRQGIAVSLNNLAYTYIGTENAAEARLYLAESLTIMEEMKDISGMLECVAITACMMGLIGDGEAAARLYGAVTALRELHEIQVLSGEQAIEEHVVEQVRSSLGAEVYASALIKGQSLSLETALFEIKSQLISRDLKS